MKSIRRHLMLPLLAGTGMLLVTGGILAYRAAHAAILAEFDYSLRTKVHDFAVLIEIENGRYEMEFVDRRMPEFERREHPEYFMVRKRNGDVLARSHSLKTADLSQPEYTPSKQPVSYGLLLPDGLPGRAAAISVNLEDSILDLVVARDTVRLNQLFHTLALGFGGTTIVLLLVLTAVLKILVRKGLLPLDEFAQQVVSVDSSNLDSHFSSSELPEELRPIALQLDQLLERIFSAFQRERYLTSAMAHELYTPIAELRAATEVAGKWPNDPEAAPAAIDQAHAIALQMQEVVDALLSLSRCEAGLQMINTKPVDISKQVQKRSERITLPLAEKNVAAFWLIPAHQIVQTDSSMLEVILSNIFSNAAEYTPKNGSIHGRIETVTNRCIITLTNTQHGLDDTDLPHLFELLWRKDVSRTSNSHSGLGLAVAKRFSDLLGIELACSLPEEDLFQVTITIPTAHPQSG